MKRLRNIKQLSAKQGSQLAAVSLYGTVLYQRIIAQEMCPTFGHEWSGRDRERHGTWWRLYKLLKTRLDALLIAPWARRPEAVSAC